MSSIVLLLFLFCLTEKVHAELEPCLLSETGSSRLDGLNSSYIGYVQTCKNGFWVSISYEDEKEWTKKNSIVTCRELGFLGAVWIMNKEGSAPHKVQTTSDVSISWQYYSVECTGLEKRLIDCKWTIKNVTSRKKDVMVLCSNALASGEIAVVGVNGQDGEGLVEIYSSVRNYRWSLVCTNEWDDADAQVACRQLGYDGGSSTYYSPDKILLSKDLPRKRYSHFDCSGDESRLTGCDFVGPYPYKCQSTYYAGVLCTKETEENTVLKLNIALLVLMITISLLLIVILLLLLRCTITKFGRKPLARRQRRRGYESHNLPSHIVHTELDLDAPYASHFAIAPPTYAETVLADQMVQSTLASESNVDDDETSDSRSEGEESSSSNLPLIAGDDGETGSLSGSIVTSNSIPPTA